YPISPGLRHIATRRPVRIMHLKQACVWRPGVGLEIHTHRIERVIVGYRAHQVLGMIVAQPNVVPFLDTGRDREHSVPFHWKPDPRAIANFFGHKMEFLRLLPPPGCGVNVLYRLLARLSIETGDPFHLPPRSVPPYSILRRISRPMLTICTGDD